MSQAPSFLSLDSLVLPPPLPAMAAILLVLGMYFVGARLARRLRGPDSSTLDEVAGFLVTLGLVAVSLLMLTWAGGTRLWLVRLIGGLFAACGMFQAYLGARRLPVHWRTLLHALRAGDPWTRVTVGVLVVGAVLLALAALGPPTDADSLDYHLGVPLEWLRAGETSPRLDWLTSRLAAAGEALNMLGLACGTDSLGAALQASGLAVATVALVALARDREGRILAAALVLSSPILCVLATTQKPQLLPTAAVATALVLLVRRFRHLDPTTVGLAFGCLGFAAACRYTFLLPGAVVGVVGLVGAHRSGQLPRTLATALAAAVVFVIPVLAWRLDLYGDPLSPFLERWKSAPDPAVTELATYLRTYGGEISALRVLRLPLDLAISFKPAVVQRVLGIGILAFVVAVRERGVPRVLLWAAAGAATIALVFAQLSPRFFATAYLFGAAAAVAATQTRLRTWLLRLLTLQAIVVVGLAALAAYSLFPGALTAGLRHEVMSTSSLGYAEARWLDSVLPPNARILALTRSRALLPRPFVVYEPTGDLPHGRDPERLRQLLRTTAPTVAVVPHPRTPLIDDLFRCRAERLAGPRSFRYAVRNPLVRSRYYRVSLLVLRAPRPGCSPSTRPHRDRDARIKR